MFYWIISLGWGSPLQPQNNGQESYSETYTAFADLDDGTYALLQLLFTNAGLGTGKAACRLLVVPSGKKGNNSSMQYGRDQWSASKTNLKVGDCRIRSKEKSTIFHAETKEGYVTLRMDAPIELRRFADAKVYPKKSDFYEQDLLILTAKVEAEIVMSSFKKTVKGFAQLDHTRSNTFLPQVAKGWYRFRGFRGAEPVFAQVRTDPKEAKFGWVYRPSTDTEYALTGFEMGATSVLNTKSGPLEISPTQVVYEYRPLESYGIMGSLAKSWVGNPVTRTYRGVGVFQGEEVEGILEIVQIE